MDLFVAGSGRLQLLCDAAKRVAHRVHGLVGVGEVRDDGVTHRKSDVCAGPVHDLPDGQSTRDQNHE